MGLLEWPIVIVLWRFQIQKKVLIPPIALFLFLIFSLSACTPKKSEKNENELRLRLSSEPPSLDWHRATDVTSRSILLNIMEPLLDLEETKDGIKVKKALFASWTSSKNFAQWNFKIQRGVKWSDGVALEGQHIVDSFARLLHPETGAFFSFLYYVIDGAKAFNTGKTKTFSKVGVSIDGEGGVRFQLNRPCAYFPKLLALMSVMPFRKDLFEKHGEKIFAAEKFVGLGPYILKKWDHDREILLVRNDKYFGEKAKLEQIRFKIINEDSTALRLFEARQIDALTSIPLQLVPKYKSRKEFYPINEISIEYLAFNLKKAPYDNLKLRKTLAMAVDRKQVVKSLSNAFRPAQSLLPEGLMFSEKFRLNETAKPTAPSGLNKGELSLHFYTDENQSLLAQNLQWQFKESLGVDLKLFNEEWKSYLGKINNDPPGMYRIGWMSLFPDPIFLLSLFTSDSAFNVVGFKNQEYDRVVAEIGKYSVGRERSQKIDRSLEILLTENVVIIPLYQGARNYLIHPKINNFPLNSMARMRFLGTQID